MMPFASKNKKAYKCAVCGYEVSTTNHAKRAKKAGKCDHCVQKEAAEAKASPSGRGAAQPAGGARPTPSSKASTQQPQQRQQQQPASALAGTRAKSPSVTFQGGATAGSDTGDESIGSSSESTQTQDAATNRYKQLKAEQAFVKAQIRSAKIQKI